MPLPRDLGLWDALVDDFFVLCLHRERTVVLAAKSRLPSMCPVREFVNADGLMSYRASLAGSFRQAAT